MTTPEPQPAAPKLKRRWYQFRLRTLLLFVLVCGVLLGWLGLVVKCVHDQQEVVSRIQTLGGGVRYDYEYCGDQLVPHPSPPGPAILRAVLGDTAFRALSESTFLTMQARQMPISTY